MTKLEYTEFTRISLKDRIKNEIDDNIDYNSLVCDLVLKTATDESILNKDEMKYCIGIRIKYELDCNNKMISSMWDAAIKSNKKQSS